MSNNQTDDLVLSSDSGDESNEMPKPKQGGKDKVPGPPKDVGRPRKQSVAAAQLAGISRLLTNYPMLSLLICCIFAVILTTGFEEYEVKEDIEKLWIEDGSIVSDELKYWKDNTVRHICVCFYVVYVTHFYLFFILAHSVSHRRL
jgi:hypothetical protein